MAASSRPQLTVNLSAIGAIAQFSPVTTAGAVAAAGAEIIGFTTQSAASGGLVSTVTSGSAVALAGAAITFGQQVQVGAGGTVIPQTSGVCVGLAMNAAASGDQVEVLLIPKGQATFSRDTSGNVTGLVGPDGGLVPLVMQQPVVCAVGDSRIALGRSTLNGGGYRLRTDGATNWIELLSQGKVLHPASHYLAISGSGYDSILSVQLPQIAALSPRPTHCVILSGTNDIGASPMSTIKSNILLVWARLRAMGIIPVHVLDLPRTVASWSATMAKQRLDLNNWIGANAASNGAIYVDGNQGFVDPANANGDPYSAFVLPDGIHPTSKGAYQVGLALKQYFDTISVPNVLRPSSNLDVYDATHNPRGNGITLGGTMSGTGGSNSGAGASGVVSTGFQNRVLTGTATAVSSQVARTDVSGYWNQIVYTATTLSTFRFSHTAVASNLTIGGTYYASVELVVTSSLLDYLQLVILNNDGTIGYAITAGDSSAYPLTDMTAVKMKLITAPFTVDVGVTDILFRIESRIQAGGSATVQIGSCEIRKIISGTA